MPAVRSLANAFKKNAILHFLPCLIDYIMSAGGGWQHDTK
jgi:hypothetical protein